MARSSSTAANWFPASCPAAASAANQARSASLRALRQLPRKADSASPSSSASARQIDPFPCQARCRPRAIMEQSMTTLRALLRQNRNYRYTWMAQVVSEIGDYFNNIAVFALVMEKSGSGLVVTGVMLSRAIPAVLAGPVAGVLLDRLDRKRIMIASDLVRALLALGFVLTVHQPRPWLLYVLSAGLMFASPFFTAGRAAI